MFELKLKPNTDPYKLACKFVKKRKLDTSLIESLSTNISNFKNSHQTIQKSTKNDS